MKIKSLHRNFVLISMVLLLCNIFLTSNIFAGYVDFTKDIHGHPLVNGNISWELVDPHPDVWMYDRFWYLTQYGPDSAEIRFAFVGNKDDFQYTIAPSGPPLFLSEQTAIQIWLNNKRYQGTYYVHGTKFQTFIIPSGKLKKGGNTVDIEIYPYTSSSHPYTSGYLAFNSAGARSPSSKTDFTVSHSPWKSATGDLTCTPMIRCEWSPVPIYPGCWELNLNVPIKFTFKGKVNFCCSLKEDPPSFPKATMDFKVNGKSKKCQDQSGNYTIPYTAFSSGENTVTVMVDKRSHCKAYFNSVSVAPPPPGPLNQIPKTERGVI